MISLLFVACYNNLCFYCRSSNEDEDVIHEDVDEWDSGKASVAGEAVDVENVASGISCGEDSADVDGDEIPGSVNVGSGVCCTVTVGNASDGFTRGELQTNLPNKPEFGPHRKLSRGEEQYSHQRELQYVKERKFICSLDLFLQLFVGCCRSSGCQEVPQVKHHFVGATLVVNTWCPAGHKIRFCSSHSVNGIYANNLQSSAAVVLSGNNYGKISRMAQFLGLAFPSKASFFRVQSLYIFPSIEEWWAWMRNELINEFVGMDVVVGGDGQCDSPGFSAKNLCYFLMELTTKYIIEVEVRDKHHVGLTSANMEKEALKNALTRLSAVLNVVEVATDASASIKKLICKCVKVLVECNSQVFHVAVLANLMYFNLSVSFSLCLEHCAVPYCHLF